MKNPAVYIITNHRNGTLYVGVTSDLIKRIWQHKNKVIDGFSKQHNLSCLVYYEIYDTMESAITREKQLKGGSRAKKIKLIENIDKNWYDLYDRLIG